MPRILLLTTFLQGALAIAALIAAGRPDWGLIPVLLSLAGAVMGGYVAMEFPQPSLSRKAAAIDACAIVCFCLGALLGGSESHEGFVIMVQTGLIVLVVGPPGLNALLLLRGADQSDRNDECRSPNDETMTKPE